MMKVSDLVTAMQHAAQEAAVAVAAEQLKLLGRYFQGGISDEALRGGETLIPVLVKMGFPRETENGPEQHDVHVPLISLAPLSALQLAEMEVEIALQAIDQEGDLLVGAAAARAPGGVAPAGQPGTAPGAASAEYSGAAKHEEGNLTVRMKFTSAGQPEGTQLIIDGYSRALRAQIPN